MENIFRDKKVGIWGLGAVGKSVLSFISPLNCTISVLEARNLSPFEKSLLEGHDALSVDPQFLPEFLEMNDFIIPSPGVNITPAFELFKKKWIIELDLFAQHVKKPVIAITGSVGKTTVTHLLTKLLNLSGKKAIAAGNIGTPMLDVLAIQDQYDIIVLELSSFQLQHAQQFHADLALVTNFYPNHLDHHADIQEYLEAKGNLFRGQKEDQMAFISMEWMDEFWPFIGKQNISWLAPDIYADITQELSDITCHQNLQLICSALDFFDIPLDIIEKNKKNLSPLEHRMEYLGICNDVHFYNDSKSTIPEATLNAVKQCTTKPLLFLGGLSKGIDREPLVEDLKNKVKHIFCFGAEAENLGIFCKKRKINFSIYASLEDAFKDCLKQSKKDDIVLFSPAGSSFDLFKNYEERGKTFKKLFISLTS